MILDADNKKRIPLLLSGLLLDNTKRIPSANIIPALVCAKGPKGPLAHTYQCLECLEIKSVHHSCLEIILGNSFIFMLFSCSCHEKEVPFSVN